VGVQGEECRLDSVSPIQSRCTNADTYADPIISPPALRILLQAREQPFRVCLQAKNFDSVLLFKVRTEFNVLIRHCGLGKTHFSDTRLMVSDVMLTWCHCACRWANSTRCACWAVLT